MFIAELLVFVFYFLVMFFIVILDFHLVVLGLHLSKSLVLLFLLEFQLLPLQLSFLLEPHFLLSAFKLLLIEHRFLFSNSVEVVCQSLANLLLALTFGLLSQTDFTTNRLLLLLKLF